MPDLLAIYQLHRNQRSGPADNAAPAFIANADAKNCQGEAIRLTVAPDGKTYTVTVGKKGKPPTYKVRAGR